MPEETTAKCVHCSTVIEQVGKGWFHTPKPGSYKQACPGMWGYVATPQEADNA